MRLRLGTKLSIGYGVIIGLLIVCAIVFFTSLNRVIGRFEDVVTKHSKAVAKIYEMQKLVIDLETGQRGFLLAGKQEFLRPYREALFNLEGVIGEERALLKKRPDLIAELEKIEALINKWQSKAGLPEINKRKEILTAEYSYTSLQKLVVQESGKRFMDQIRLIFSQLEKRFISQNKKNHRLYTVLAREALISAETGMRGFLISGKDTFLVPYNEGTIEFETNLEKLKKISSSDKKAQSLITQIKHFSETWQSQAAEVMIEARAEIERHPASMDEISQMIATATGKEIMDDIRDHLSSFTIKLKNIRDAEFDKSQEDAFISQIVIVMTIVFGILFSLLSSILVVISVTGPVRRLMFGTQRVAKGDLTTFVKPTSNDEISDLTKAFNFMTGTLQKTTVSKDYVDNIIKSMIDTLIVATPEGSIQMVNQGTLDLLGYEEKELIGRPVRTIFADEEASPFMGTRLEKLVKDGYLKNYDITYQSKSGERIPMNFSGSVMRDKKGSITGVVGVAKDVREFQAIQEKLQRSEKLSNVGKLAGLVGHELRNPLGVIRISISGLKRRLKEQGNAKVDRGLERIEEEVLKSDKIIEDILTFSRVKEPTLAVGNLKLVLDHILSDIPFQNNIEVENKISSDVPDMLIDGLQLQQVFRNLILNAAEAMTETGGVLTVSTQKKNEFIVISIQDTGCGIPKEYMPKIFEPLFTTKMHGTGLGLAVCKSLVEGHHGSINVESEKDKGTTFTVEIPINKPITEKKPESLKKAV